MATVSDLSKGNYMRYNGEVVQVEELQHRTPATCVHSTKSKCVTYGTAKWLKTASAPAKK